jgi:hypothetical protein
MTVVGRHCRSGGHWACYGRAGGPGRIAGQCACWCHELPEGAVTAGPWRPSETHGVIERDVEYGEGLRSVQFRKNRIGT